MRAAPVVEPILTIGCGKPVVLNDDCDEEPFHDIAAKDSTIESGNFIGELTVIVW